MQNLNPVGMDLNMPPTPEPKKKKKRLKVSYRPKIQTERTFKRRAKPETNKQERNKRAPRRASSKAAAAGGLESLATGEGEAGTEADGTSQRKTPKRTYIRKKKASKAARNPVNLETVTDPTGPSEDARDSCMGSLALHGESGLLPNISTQCQQKGAEQQVEEIEAKHAVEAPKLLTYSRRSALSLNFIPEAQMSEKSPLLRECEHLPTGVDGNEGKETKHEVGSTPKPVTPAQKPWRRKHTTKAGLKITASEHVGIDFDKVGLNLDKESFCKKSLDFNSEVKPGESSVLSQANSRKAAKKSLKRDSSKAVNLCLTLGFPYATKKQRTLRGAKRAMRHGDLCTIVRFPNATKKQRSLRKTKRAMRKFLSHVALPGKGNSNEVSLELSLAVGGETFFRRSCDADNIRNPSQFVSSTMQVVSDSCMRSSMSHQAEHQMLKDTVECSNNLNFPASCFKDKQVGGPLEEESAYVQSSVEGREQQFFLPSTPLPTIGELRSDDPIGNLALSLQCANEIDSIASVESHNAIVLFREDSHFQKRKHFQPEVKLDQETKRMWELLTKNEGTEEINEEQEKYWRDERRIFQVRIDKFLACMHCVQGDRRFSKWKGSVLDSVIGVYLTQNVSDHLSSHAFMALASRFPSQSTTSSVGPNGEGTISKSSEEQEIDKLLDQNRPTEVECEDMYGEKETENRIESSFSHEGSAAPNNLEGKSVDNCEDIQELSQESQGTSIEAPQQLEQHAENSNIPTVGEGPTPVSEEKNGESKTAEIHFEYESNHAEGYKKTVTVRSITGKKKSGKQNKEKEKVDWDRLKRDACCSEINHQSSVETLDSLDYEALRHANVKDIADTIRMRGMNNRIAERMQDFLNKLVSLHGSMDLEWLRFFPQDKVNDYLQQFKGLGLKSVECVRLLCLQHQAFPVDTNVARISVRLGWVPLQPLPTFIQIHVLDQYPDMNNIQEYLWPRLCKLDPQTLYELHYQMITFGKVFCTKRRPNCQACPLKEDCRHYASACASEKFALPNPQEKEWMVSVHPTNEEKGHGALVNTKFLGIPERNTQYQAETGLNNFYVTLPASPVSESSDVLDSAMDNAIQDEEPDGIPEIEVVIEGSSKNLGTQGNFVDLQEEDIPDIEDYPLNVKTCTQENRMDIQDLDLSKALIVFTPKAASRPMPKIKNLNRLRTEHLVYELPDGHPLLTKFEPRVDGDPCPYLLAIWSPGETAESIQLPVTACSFQESGNLCDKVTCFACNSVKEANTQCVRGTLLIPCRTALRGRFPLNGTYFQNNEVFADDETSKQPINVPRNLIWNLHQTTAFFGSSVSSIFDNLTLDKVQLIFWTGYICTKGFERSSRAPRPLRLRFHCPLSKRPTSKRERKTPKNG